MDSKIWEQSATRTMEENSRWSGFRNLQLEMQFLHLNIPILQV